MVCWFAGLFYLPRLFVYHAANRNDETQRLLALMQWRLYYYIMVPSVIVVLITGSALVLLNPYRYLFAHYFQLKMVCVLLLLVYFGYCGWHLHQFNKGVNQYSSRYFRVFNELPTVLLIVIVCLVVIKPCLGCMW